MQSLEIMKDEKIVHLIGFKKYIARKDYKCFACETILTLSNEDYYDDVKPKNRFDSLLKEDHLFIDEKRALIKAKENKYKIKKGDIYLRWAKIKDGKFQTCRAIPEIALICSAYDIWEIQIKESDVLI